MDILLKNEINLVEKLNSINDGQWMYSDSAASLEYQLQEVMNVDLANTFLKQLRGNLPARLFKMNDFVSVHKNGLAMKDLVDTWNELDSQGHSEIDIDTLRKIRVIFVATLYDIRSTKETFDISVMKDAFLRPGTGKPVDKLALQDEVYESNKLEDHEDEKAQDPVAQHAKPQEPGVLANPQDLLDTNVPPADTSTQNPGVPVLPAVTRVKILAKKLQIRKLYQITHLKIRKIPAYHPQVRKVHKIPAKHQQVPYHRV